MMKKCDLKGAVCLMNLHNSNENLHYNYSNYNHLFDYLKN